MPFINVFTILTMFTICGAINRPVYKIILTQKGFAQFLQYDVETPPMQEFTFCAWIKLYEFTRDQSIFTYVTPGNNRVVRLWLDSGGRYMKFALNGKISSSYPVDLVKDVWHNVCISYQSDYGAWALYIDGHLVACEAAESLNGFVLPPSGSVILGYGTSENGGSGGLEGEVFGANMILASTIERNHTMKRNPQFRQKYFQKNKVMGDTNIKYVILGNMQSETKQLDFESTTLPAPSNMRSYIAIKTPHSVVDHEVGSDLVPKKFNQDENIDDKDISNLLAPKQPTVDDDKVNFWNLINMYETDNKFKGSSQLNPEQIRRTKNNPILSEYETPPPPSQEFDYSQYASAQAKMKRPIIKPLFEMNGNDISQYTRKTVKLNKATISNIETPPTTKSDNKVYGQWTSTNFANNVLSYLKSNNININSKLKRVPPTIPLIKTSDSFPYSTDFRNTPFKFQRRSFLDKQLKIMKRDIHNPKINVKIINNDIRGPILKSHALTNPKDVEIINVGDSTPVKERRFYRNVDTQGSDKIILADIFKPHPFSKLTNMKLNRLTLGKDLSMNNNLITILPFLKSNEYYIEDENENKQKNKSNIYTKLSSSNKWRNVKSYSNDYTPRRLNMESSEINNDNTKIIDENKKFPPVRLKYVPDNHKIIKSDIDSAILKGRNLALEISNNSDPFSESVSILKYNHGFLPGYNFRKKSKQTRNEPSTDNGSTKRKLYDQNNFNQNIKIGNALNERTIIGFSEEQKYKSFIGGNEKVPDINRYRSELDKVNNKVPPSLGPKICKNLELFDRLLFIQPDESIDVTHIMSPVKQKNIAIEFILQNYKKCSWEDSVIKNHQLLYIDWSKTPVRLFGGAYPRKTTDLCGFF